MKPDVLVFYSLSRFLSSFESNTFTFSISGQTHTNTLPLLCAPNSKLVAGGNRQQHPGTAALLGSGGMQLPALPLPRHGAHHSQRSPALRCPQPSAQALGMEIPFPAPGERRLSGKVEQSSAVTHVPAATGGREPGISRAGGTAERSRHSGSSGRVPPLPYRGSTAPHRGSSRRVSIAPHRGSPAGSQLSTPGLIPVGLGSPTLRSSNLSERAP